MEQTVEIPEGWTVRQDEAANTLEGLTFYSGPPEEKASLVYDQWTKRNGLAYGVWRFQPNLLTRSGSVAVIIDPRVSQSNFRQRLQNAQSPTIQK